MNPGTPGGADSGLGGATDGCGSGGIDGSNGGGGSDFGLGGTNITSGADSGSPIVSLSGTGTTPPEQADLDYVAGVGEGGAAMTNTGGGNGLIVLQWQ